MLGRYPHQVVGAAVLGCRGKPAHNRSKNRFLTLHRTPAWRHRNGNSLYDKVDCGRPDVLESDGDQTPPGGRTILAMEGKSGTQRDCSITAANGFLQRA